MEGDELDATASSLSAQEFSHLSRCIREVFRTDGYAFSDSFEFGLDLILDGLVTLRDRAPSAR